MIRAWYMDDEPINQRNEHHKNPPHFITLEELFEISGVKYFKLNIDTVDVDGVLNKIKKDLGYTYEEEIICSKDSLPSYNEKMNISYTEHMHPDEEMRLVIDGSGYFDVRDKADKWIRIEVGPGDLLILPSGIYHKFIFDNKNYIRIRRIFPSNHVWMAHNRHFDHKDEGIEEEEENLDKCS